MSQLNLKPAHAAVKTYYAALTQMGQLHFDNEAQVSDAFAKLLANCGRKLHLTFVPQFSIQRARTRVIVDGALVDDFHLAHGFWEAKDEKDDLEREIKSKFEKGYPRDNIIFQAPERAVLYQSGARIADEDISNPDYLTQIVNQFFDYKAPTSRSGNRPSPSFPSAFRNSPPPLRRSSTKSAAAIPPSSAASTTSTPSAVRPSIPISPKMPSSAC